MKQITIAVLCSGFEIHSKSGYSRAFELYKHIAQKNTVKLIIPFEYDIYIDETLQLDENMTMQIITPSIEFSKRIDKVDEYLYFYRYIDKDEIFVNKLVGAIQNVDIIICNHYCFVSLAKRVFPDKTVIFRSLDIEYDKICDIFQFKQKSLFTVPVHIDEGIKTTIYNFEREAINNSDYIITITKEDKQRLIELYKPDAKKLSIIPICFSNIAIFSGFVPRPRKKTNIINALFISYIQYDAERTVKRIVEVSRELPNVVFHIVGSIGTVIPIEDIHMNIIIYGEVSEEKKYEITNKCDFALNITGQTYGMNAKTLDAFSLGIPLLSNKLGIRGYDVQENIDYFPTDYYTLADDIMAFSKLSTDDRHKIAVNAFHYICKHHNYDKHIDKIETIINDFSNNRNNIIKERFFIFGAGNVGKNAFFKLNKLGYDCIGITDNNYLDFGDSIYGVKVVSPDYVFSQINSDDSIKLVIAVGTTTFLAQIYNQAKKRLSEDNIHIFWQNTLNYDKIDREKLLFFLD